MSNFYTGDFEIKNISRADADALIKTLFGPYEWQSYSSWEDDTLRFYTDGEMPCSFDDDVIGGLQEFIFAHPDAVVNGSIRCTDYDGDYGSPYQEFVNSHFRIRDRADDIAEYADTDALVKILESRGFAVIKKESSAAATE